MQKKSSPVELLERETESQTKLKKPDMYAVILLNDDYTPQEFVVWVLIKVFYKTPSESQEIMLNAHTKGRALVDIYTFDIARTKVTQVREFAEENEHPLECIIEAQAPSED